MKTSEQMAVEFHEGMDLPVATTPAPLTADRLRLRLNLIAEEVGELIAAMCGWVEEDEDEVVRRMRALVEDCQAGIFCEPDLAAIAKELCDVHVVTSGTAVEYGIPEDACYADVHASNMAKVGGPVRGDGKRLKPPSWTPPDLAPILALAREAAD